MEPSARTHGRFFASVQRVLAGGALVALAACGGGGSSHTSALPVAATAKPAANGIAHFTLTIPKRTATTASKRRTQYVSASTQAVEFTVTPGGVPPTQLNLTSSNCAPTPQGNAETCTLPVAAPIGVDTFSMVAYDQPFNPNGSQPVGTNALSAASNFTATIAEGTANVTLPLISGGIPATLSIALSGGPTPTFTNGTAKTLPMTVTVYDADNNIIVAPGAYVDANGNPAPVTITASGAAGTAIGYAVTPAGSTVAGALSSTITLNQPDDSVVLSYSGNGYLAGEEDLAHTIPENVGGGTITKFGFGWIFTPPFAPSLLLAPPLSIFESIGHPGIYIADGTNRFGFVGDIMTSCTLPSVSAGTVVRVGGMAFDTGQSDENIYALVDDTGAGTGTVLDAINGLLVLSNTCSLLAHQATARTVRPRRAVAASQGQMFGVFTNSGADFDNSFALPGLSFLNGGIIDSATGFGTQAVGISPNGSLAYIQFGAKKRLDQLSTTAFNASAQVSLAGMTDGDPGGLVIDGSGLVFANDTTVATYGANGGIDGFDASLNQLNHIQLASQLSQSGPSGALQNMAIGNWAGGTALFAVTAAGIEVFPMPLDAAVAGPIDTLTLPQTPVSIVTDAGGREWVLLSNGTIDALPAE